MSSGTPPLAPSRSSRSWQLLLLSAETPDGLETATRDLADHLGQHPESDLADVAYALQIEVRALDHRRAIVCRSREDAVDVLRRKDATRILSSESGRNRPVIFMLSGVGDQYVGMAHELYIAEPVFRQEVDECCDLLQPLLNVDLRRLLYPEAGLAPPAHSGVDLLAMLERSGGSTAAGANPATWVQPAVFVVEYALARLLMHWGIRPQALIGHSLGEYAAACLAGVLSLQDALRLVARRAQWIQGLPQGAMLAVLLPEAEVQPLLGASLSLAIVNAPSVCVVAGPIQAIEALEGQLLQQSVACRRLETTHALHSAMMEPLGEPLTEFVRSMRLFPPEIPCISNVTGTWMTPQQATDPTYWAQHMCQTVRFEDGLRELFQNREAVLLEVGPGQSLSSFAKQHPACTREQMARVLPTLRYQHDHQSDVAFLLTSLAKMWLAGVSVDWASLHADEPRPHIPWLVHLSKGPLAASSALPELATQAEPPAARGADRGTRRRERRAQRNPGKES